MKFRTEINIERSLHPLDPKRAVVLMGSCFSDSVGGKMRRCRWDASVNPCGVLYNPLSIGNVILAALSSEREEIVHDSLAEINDHGVSWLTDSGCDRSTREATMHEVLSRFDALPRIIRRSQALIVTFGTAWVYELTERSGYVVSNCHKFPASMFRRRRLTIEEICSTWESVIREIRILNPDIRLIFTVSPIRHLKDGFEGNMRSKAILQLACERLTETIGNVEYFPAYEILNDDLRDYRFYTSDMVHPSDDAVEYIWEKFCERYITSEGFALLKEGLKITKRSEHRSITGTL